MSNPDSHGTAFFGVPPPMPSLARPFALFGACAGFFAILAAAGFRSAARDVSPLLPLVVTAGAGAILGVALRSWPRLQDPSAPREIVVFWVAVLTAATGAVSGGAVGLLEWGDDGFARFAAGGAALGLVFTPSCLVVFDAARRAGRARHGSLVAGTDRRTVLSTVLAGVAFAGATHAPSTLAAQASTHLTSAVEACLALLACLGATLGVVVLQRKDREARAALDAIAAEATWLDRVQDAGDEDAPPPALDLGLGDEHWARGEAGYRTSGRRSAEVKGSVADAVSAFEECARRRHRSLLVATCSLTAVSVATALRLWVLA